MTVAAAVLAVAFPILIVLHSGHLSDLLSDERRFVATGKDDAGD